MSLLNHTLQTAIEWFLFHCEYEKRLNPKTLQAYTSDLKQMLDFMEREASVHQVGQVTPDVIRGYLKGLASYKAKTIKRKMASAKAFFNYMEQEFDDYLNPMRKVRIKIKVPLILPNVLTLSEIGQILTYLYTKKEQTPTDERDQEKLLRLIAIVELLFGTGLRVSELCSLHIGDIDLQEGLVKVYGKGSRERVIQICQSAIIAAIEDYLRISEYQGSGATRPLFLNLRGEALEAQSVRASIKALAREAGISKRMTPHTFRHTLATLLLEEGVDIKYIQTILGHSSLSTTQIYTHVTNTRQKIILRDFHPRRRILASSDSGKR